MPTRTDSGDEEDRSSQMYAALGVGFVCVVIGIPLWWKTTEVYRVSLPYSDIAELQHTKIQFSVEVEVIKNNTEFTDIIQLSSSLSNKLQPSGQAEISLHFRVNVRDSTSDEEKYIQKFSTLSDLDKALTLQGDDVNQYKIIMFPSNNKFKITKPYLGIGRIFYISSFDGKDVSSVSETIALVLQNTIVKPSRLQKSFHAGRGTGDRTLKPDKESMRSVRSHTAYDITFSLVNPQPDILNVQWDIEHAVKTYLDPLINQLKDYADINIKSQLLYFIGLVRRPQPKSGEYHYTEKDLPHIINPLEAKLGSHTSSNPSLDFLVYIPSRDQHPLYLVDESGTKVKSNAFLSPRWGGIYIENINHPRSNDTLPLPVSLDMKAIMQVFLSQLRLLLSLYTQKSADMTAGEVGSQVIAQWELDSWLRARCAENLGTSIATLQSLAQLLGEISNIVIQDDIGEQVYDAVASVKESQRHLLGGRLDQGFLESRKAIQCSEKAFFDQSLLELLYFPEDQKFAIYIPLFLPISLPVLASLHKAVRWMRNKRKPKQE